MTTVSVRQILTFIFITGFIALIIAIATEPGNFNSHASSRGKAYAAFQVIAAISLGVVIVLEALVSFTSLLQDNRFVHTISTVFMAISCISLIIACSVYSSFHFPYGWTVAACTMVMEAIVIFVITHLWVS